MRMNLANRASSRAARSALTGDEPDGAALAAFAALAVAEALPRPGDFSPLEQPASAIAKRESETRASFTAKPPGARGTGDVSRRERLDAQRPYTGARGSRALFPL